MAENNQQLRPCPFVERCGFVTEECTEELAGACPVIVKPKPEPVKMYNPQEPVAITLTNVQWRSVCWKLEYCMNVSRAKVIEFTDHPAHACFAESAAQHKAEAEKVAGILGEIEKQLGWDK